MKTADARRTRLLVVFAFLLFYAMILSLLRTDPTTAQLVFRVAISTAGAVGLIWLLARRG